MDPPMRVSNEQQGGGWCITPIKCIKTGETAGLAACKS